MADKKVSLEDAASAFDGTELFRVVQAGASKKGTLAQIKDYIESVLVALLTALGVFPSRELVTESRSYYVATTGSDAADGLTAETPFLTLQKALDTVMLLDFAGAGEATINLAAGAYDYSYLSGDVRPGADNSYCLSIVGAGAATTTVDSLEIYGPSSIHISELTFSNGLFVENGSLASLYNVTLSGVSCDGQQATVSGQATLTDGASVSATRGVIDLGVQNADPAAVDLLAGHGGRIQLSNDDLLSVSCGASNGSIINAPAATITSVAVDNSSFVNGESAASAIRSRTITLTVAEIATLSTAVSVLAELVPAQGANKVIVPHHIISVTNEHFSSGLALDFWVSLGNQDSEVSGNGAGTGTWPFGYSAALAWNSNQSIRSFPNQHHQFSGGSPPPSLVANLPLCAYPDDFIPIPGAIVASTIGAGGTGWAVNDRFTIVPAPGFNPQYGTVTGVDAGAITTYTLDDPEVAPPEYPADNTLPKLMFAGDQDLEAVAPSTGDGAYITVTEVDLSLNPMTLKVKTIYSVMDVE